MLGQISKRNHHTPHWHSSCPLMWQNAWLESPSFKHAYEDDYRVREKKNHNYLKFPQNIIPKIFLAAVRAAPPLASFDFDPSHTKKNEITKSFDNLERKVLHRGSTKLVPPGWQYWGKKLNFFFVRAVRIFRTIARCSKYDFWNLWEIWDRNRYTENFWSKIFWSKKIRTLLVEKYFWTKIFRFFDRKKNRWKSQWKFKILRFRKIFEKKQKSQNFEFSLTFSTKIFSTKNRKILVPKIFFDQTFSDFFRRKMFRPKIFRVPISIPNFPKIPKIILKTACDRSKNTNSTHEEKVQFFSSILP